MQPTLIRRSLGGLVPPKIATPSILSSGSGAGLGPLVNFYSKLPKGPAPASATRGFKERYCNGKNASPAPLLFGILGILGLGYTIDYQSQAVLVLFTHVSGFRAPQEPPPLMVGAWLGRVRGGMQGWTSCIELVETNKVLPHLNPSLHEQHGRVDPELRTALSWLLHGHTRSKGQSLCCDCFSHALAHRVLATRIQGINSGKEMPGTFLYNCAGLDGF
ncbi:ATP synthase subunit f, mitochondrial [Grifola frondosa]|uniref:ATP synthase subunit f, mitochondrial n=1 Tax=Grifola frondosa TaxID=5627 RepID=A0A1C7ML35_GRIFR|nr:ATP synthase subunit f, mitochondrial [Grifola frondosa]